MAASAHGWTGLWTVLDAPGSGLVVVGGVPTAEDVAAVSAAIDALLADGADVLVEVTGLTACPIALLEALVRARRRARRRRMGFAVTVCGAGAPREVHRVLSLVGLTTPLA